MVSSQAAWFWFWLPHTSVWPPCSRQICISLLLCPHNKKNMENETSFTGLFLSINWVVICKVLRQALPTAPATFLQGNLDFFPSLLKLSYTRNHKTNVHIQLGAQTAWWHCHTARTVLTELSIQNYTS